MNIAICDDNDMIRNQVGIYVNQFFKDKKRTLPNLTFFACGEDFISSSSIPDIVFLDIEMSNMNGITVGRYLKDRSENVIIIYLTSYMDYLDDAMQLKAFRYISKPIQEKRFFNCLDDAINELTLLNHTILLETSDGCFCTNVKDIIYLETTLRGCIIHTQEGSINSPQSIAWWNNQLSEYGFYLVHRSFLINLSYVISFSHDMVFLSNNNTVFLSRRKYNDFKNTFVRYLERRR